MIFRLLLSVFCLSPGFHLYGQQPVLPTTPPINQDDLERILEESGTEEGDFDNNTILEIYETLAERRININRATREQLEELGILDAHQVASILNYIKSFGAMKSPYELLGVYGLDRETIRLLLPYIYFTEEAPIPQSLKEQFRRGKSNIFLRYSQVMEKARGYTPPTATSTTRYVGDRSRLYARYRFNFGTQLSMGMTIEKDPGEKIWSKDYKGFNYISAHFFMRNRGPVKALALGDFTVNLGQGLMLFQGFGLGKGTAVTKLKKSNRQLAPHTSANEYNYFTGAGATFSLGKKKAWDLTAFGSYRNRDGSLVESDSILETEAFVTSLQTSGYHRTPSEIRNRNTVAMSNAGGSVRWMGGKSQISANVLYTHLSKPLQRSNDPYNFHAFKGRELVNASVDYSFLHNRLLLFGEGAISQNGGFALMNAAVLKAMPGVDLSIVHRYYAKNYQQLFGNAFGEGSQPVNETGIYAGLSIRPAKFITWESYIDWYYFPWLRFLVDAPSSGTDIYSRVTVQPNRYFTFFVQGRYETKGYNVRENDTPLDYPDNYKKGSLRANWQFNASSQISLRTRVDASWYKGYDEDLQDGFYAAQDLTYRDKKDRFYVTGRLAMFRTDSYDTRIYAYENDVLYAFSIPANYGKGMRWYALLKYSPSRYTDIWVRLAQTIFSDRDVISSGLEEIKGNRRTEIKIQLRIKW
jgi:hypothetical protein